MTTPAAPANPVQVTAAQLTAIFPQLSVRLVLALVPGMNQALIDIGAVNSQCACFFIGQVGHETGEFKYSVEVASGDAYEGRADLGNTQPGDGRRYKGRGWIQLTGRDNYRAAGKALGLDLEGNPELAASPDVAGRTAAWYWNSRDLTRSANAGDFARVTRKINGGYNGWDHRVAVYRRACAALGIQPLKLEKPTPPPAPAPKKPA